MTDRDHPVDDALRKVAGEPTPSDHERRLGAERLARAIGAERRPRRRFQRRLVLGWAIGVAVLLVGVVVIVEAFSPTPTEAAIEEIAQAAEHAEPLTIPPQQFAYTKSETTALAIVPKDALGGIPYNKDSLVYLLPTERETWIGNEGSVQIRTTNQPPTFFTEEDEDTYYQAGIDQQDAIGETTTLTTTDQPTRPDWPSDPIDLDQAIREVAVTDRGLPEPVEYLDVALDILRENFASPELRAATLRLIGQLPGLRLSDTAEASDLTFSIEYEDQGTDTRLTFTVGGRGHLLYEETRILETDAKLGIPPGTSTFTATHDPPVIVSELETP